MHVSKAVRVVAIIALFAGNLWGADVVLNEYNAVGGADFLGGGDAAADDAGARASDSYFGRVQGNGGDWFELVVITDHLNMQGWQLDILEDGVLDETLDLTDHPIWSDLRSGTIITVAEDVPTDASYDPAAGDWWINVQANDSADGLYIEPSAFPVGNSNWQLRVRDAAGTVVFGPAGEGVSPPGGVSATEVFRLEDDPTATVTPNSNDYDDGADFSTFGAPNRWGVQNLTSLRESVTSGQASITLLSPNDPNLAFVSGDLVTVRWDSDGIDEPVLIEFSVNDGITFSPVYPPNLGNTGQYIWLVPLVDSDLCLVRVSSTTRPSVHDVSDDPFVIMQSLLVADLNGDGLVNFFDFEALASAWLASGTL